MHRTRHPLLGSSGPSDPKPINDSYPPWLTGGILRLGAIVGDAGRPALFPRANVRLPSLSWGFTLYPMRIGVQPFPTRLGGANAYALTYPRPVK